MNLFAQAAQNLPLSPAERALLRFVKGLIVTAIAAGMTAAAPFVFVGPNQTVDWHQVLTVGLSVFGVTLFNTIMKYFTAHADPQPQVAVNLPSTPPATGDAT